MNGNSIHLDAPRIGAQRPARIASIDLLRGFVMIVMALDHVRDFVHQGAMVASPTDLATTSFALFATRWVTHICAPAFALTAGMGAFLGWRAGGSRLPLSGFLVSRGLWLMLLDLLVMRLALYFSWSPASPIMLLVLWTLGLSMVVLAALIWLPIRLLGLLAATTILTHPLLDAVAGAGTGTAAGLWNVVHQVGAFSIGGATVVTPYPLVPWVAVMALGFSLGPLFDSAPTVRRRTWLILGGALLAAFFVLRLINLYGDPAPWRVQESSLFTLLSFLNVTKYPASPAFLLMTLGITFLLLAWLDRRSVEDARPARMARVFGGVPLFFYVLHFFLAHAIATALAFLSYGDDARNFAFQPYPSLGGAAAAFPPGFGHTLPVTYSVWLAVLALSYPVCRWFAKVRAARRAWWLRYL